MWVESAQTIQTNAIPCLQISGICLPISGAAVEGKGHRIMNMNNGSRYECYRKEKHKGNLSLALRKDHGDPFGGTPSGDRRHREKTGSVFH